jgi:peptide/nickel transport system substrate-binding protein
MIAALLAACGDNTATVPAATTAAATTAAATTAAATTSAAATTAAATSAAATTAAATSAAATTAAATSAAATTAAATSAAATTAAATTAAATTAATAGGSSDIIENVKMDGTSGKKGGQLVLAFAGQGPSQLNPYYGGETVAVNNARMIWGYVIGQSSNAEYYPYLVTEVPTLDNGGVKVTGDKMDITLKLKPNQKWSDGSAMTSADYKYTWQWVTDADNTGLYADTTPWKLITSVDTPDTNTVVLHFSQILGPYLNFLNGFYPLPQKVWSTYPIKNDPSKFAESTQPTVTSGPFKVDEFVADDRITYSRNDNFSWAWGFNAYLDKVVFRFTKDANSAVAALQSGDIDEVENLDDNAVDANTKIAAASNAKFDIAPQFAWEYLQFNLDNPLFKSKAVRQALLQAIDREALVKQFRTPKTVVLPTNCNPISAFCNQTLKPLPYDLAAAKKLLTDDGWAPGADGIMAKGGQKLSFTLSSTTAPVRVATAEVILTYWKALGADAKFQSYASTAFFGPWANDGILSRGKFDIGMFAQTADVDPDSGYGNYHSSAIPTDANKGNGANYGRINDPKIDAALATEKATVDIAARKAAFADFYKVIYDNVYEGSLYTRVNNYIVSNKVHNYKANPTTDANLWNVVELWVG